MMHHVILTVGEKMVKNMNFYQILPITQPLCTGFKLNRKIEDTVLQ